MINRLIFSFLTLLALFSGNCLAQQARNLNVDLQLDQPYDQALVIEVSVRNHSFIIVPPTFTILRPILSSVTQTVVIAQGELNAALSIEDISVDAIDYSIRFRCLSCASSVPTQYFTASGTRLGLVNDAYIAPQALPSSINVSLQTLGFITGQVLLDNGALADSNVRTTIRLSDSGTGQLVSRQPITILAGDTKAEYRFEGLRRSGGVRYLLQLGCSNCRRVRQSVDTALDSAMNHSGIDYVVQERRIDISGIVTLLLSETSAP